MKYPEPGASYKHEPKFIDRMKRAEGGEVDHDPISGQPAGEMAEMNSYKDRLPNDAGDAQEARDVAASRVRNAGIHPTSVDRFMKHEED
jgi:hypothetical protein